MNISNGKIGTRELLALILLTVGLKQTDVTPTALFPYGLTATWMFPIISAILLIVPFLLLLRVLKRHENKDLIQLTYDLTGNYIGFVISLLLFIFIFSTTVSYSRSTVDTLNTLFFPKTPQVILYVSLLAVGYFIASKGLEVLGRTSWLTAPYLFIALFILFVLLWHAMEWHHVKPFGGPGVGELLYEGGRHSYLVGEFILFTVLYPCLRSHREFRIASLLGIFIVTIELTIFYAAFLMVYGYPSVENIAFPFQQLTRIVDLGRVFSNAESLFLGFWAIATITRTAIYLYITVTIFAYMLKLKAFAPLFLPFTGVIFFLGLVPESNIENVLFLRESLLLQLNWLFILVLPVLLWILDNRRKRRRVG